MQFCVFSVLLAHFPFLFSCMFAFFDIGVYPLKLDIYLPNLTDTKSIRSFIAKDVVAKGLDHDTFVLSIREIKPKKLDTEPVRSQLRGDFLLGRDQAE
ncbi:hypothetical protein F2Q70_00015053 [Brassica cretica]|uniref:Uncharacterized protein n=1 Tax=Brassica cretica TaxID=69181 RepID=A0A8S9HV62_BRACR|nr:hypothetical protein F2Q70_00015053 [Brassica cretica]